MANQEQLDILKQGVEAWNQWTNGLGLGIVPDLSGAALAGADLGAASADRREPGGRNRAAGGGIRRVVHAERAAGFGAGVQRTATGAG